MWEEQFHKIEKYEERKRKAQIPNKNIQKLIII